MSEQPGYPPPLQYQFRVRGHLGESTRQALADVEFRTDGADTLLTAGVLDLAAVYALVEQIERLGLDLRGIRPLLRDAEA